MIMKSTGSSPSTLARCRVPPVSTTAPPVTALTHTQNASARDRLFNDHWQFTKSDPAGEKPGARRYTGAPLNTPSRF